MIGERQISNIVFAIKITFFSTNSVINVVPLARIMRERITWLAAKVFVLQYIKYTVI
jgi:hypothetical protein